MTSNAIWPKLFPKKYVSFILQDVLDCSTDLKRPPATEKRPEDALTKEVYKRLCRLERYRNGPLEPHIESWLTDLEHRADIRFMCGRGIETYFIVEAKRLFVVFPRGKLDSLVGEYINHGMMRFINKEYAPYQESSAMLAYVYDVDLLTAKDTIKETINKNAKKLCLEGDFCNCLLELNPTIHETQHVLSDKQFILYHLFTIV